MSGQLVGEVIAAAERLRRLGLPERAFHALVAIAEKSHAESRQGSVRWAWIQSGLYGASKRTAERAVGELRAAGVVRIAKTGFGNGFISRAPIYEIAPLVDTDTAVSQSQEVDTDTAVSQSTESRYRQTGSRYRQTGSRYRHLGVVLDGSIDGPIDGAPPPQHCPKHPDGTDEPCRRCRAARQEREKWDTEQAHRDRQVAEEHRLAVDECVHCDDAAWMLGPDGTPVEPATRCPLHPRPVTA